MFKNTMGLAGLLLFGLLCFVSPVMARENVTDWYVQDLRAEFVLSADSTMTVTEWITADCGTALDKHGIFRTVPTEARTGTETIKTPVELISITDFGGKKYAYTETENRSDGTVTWKIGDGDKTVQGVNYYKITYLVKNVIRSQESSDEFYWNVGGNFWELPIDVFTADMVFPQSVQNIAQVSYYAGTLGSKENTLVTQSWKDDRTVSLVATQTLLPGEGVTVSVSVPQGIFIPYQFGWWEQYSQYLWIILPILVFWGCFKLWKRYGDDPKWDKVVIPEYEIPGGLSMLELGTLSTNGTLKNEFLTAAIIELAVMGALRIKETTEKILFFKTTDYVLEKQVVSGLALPPHQQLLLDTLFQSGNEVKLSALKTSFYKVVPTLKKQVIGSLAEKGLIEKKGLNYRIGFLIFAGVGAFLAFQLFAAGVYVGGGAALLAAGIAVIFGLIMPKRTLKGVEVNWKIKGLKLYMETAEKERQRFHEKEGMFETLLPVAMVFGMTTEWIKKMRDMYGEEYMKNYHPAWFVATDMGSFDVDSFSSHIESLSSSIATNTGTPSGSGGSGSSGGGGGGGGGGGW
ncbi:MAG: DUF2207 domain-containing protein [Candidatus Moraniibacteriota bacterium]